MDIAVNKEVNGILIYHSVTKWGLEIIKIPILTPYMGLWVSIKEGNKLHQNTSQERNVLKNLIKQLPNVFYFSQMYPPNFMNWQPFQWANFRHQLLVTHIIEDLTDLDAVFNNFKENTQKKIRKAAKTIYVEKSEEPQIVYDIYTQILKRYGRTMSYSLPFLENLHQEIQKNKAGQLYIARSVADAQIHAALYIVWDSTTAYYWLGGSDERFRNSGALTFLIWSIITDLSLKGIQKFDFTGSSMENLETFFTSFGAKKVPYLAFNRYRNPFFELLHFIKKLKR